MKKIPDQLKPALDDVGEGLLGIVAGEVEAALNLMDLGDSDQMD
jgi:hypothetical protein